jgi:uncharacterized repeat protein (TIGR01451 family)
LATVTVNTANDVFDGDVTSLTQLANSPGVDGLISLREAIVATNNTTGPDTIEFDTSLNGTLIVLAIASVGADQPESGDLDISDDLTVRGNGAGITIIDASGLDPDGSGPEFGDRVVEITNGVVTFERVTVTGGHSADYGGGILNSGGAGAVHASVISGNRAMFSGGGIASRAKYRSSSFQIEASTISGNTAGQNGGGVYNFAGTSTAAMTVANSTISGNAAAASSGGGIANFGKYDTASLEIYNSTISGNTADVAGGGVANAANNGNTIISNISSTIIANNTAGNGEHDFAQQGTLQTAEFNLIESSAGHAIADGVNGNRVGVDPLLGPLQINGGLTPTHTLLTGSPAIDAGANPQSLANDQRGAGFPRDAGEATDMGAFETGGRLSGVKFDDINGSGRRAVGIQGSDPHVVFVIDISGSTDTTNSEGRKFAGTPVGDRNGDGNENDIIDAEIAAFQTLNSQLEELVDAEILNSARVSIVSFASSAETVLLSSPPNANVSTALASLQGAGQTNYEAALEQALAVLTGIPTTDPSNANVVFLSDGFPFPTPQDIAGRVADLRNFGANLRAFGAGDGASITDLLTIDPDAVIFNDSDSLTGAFQAVDAGSIGEPGIGGVTIFLDLNGDGTLNPGEPSTVTGADGTFQFLNAPAGTFTVREIVPPNSAPTTEPFTVTVGSGTNQIGLEFGNFTLVTLSGTKFLDLNENGVQDTGEPPLPGVFIGLDETGPEDNSFSNDRDTRTDSNGNYRFENVGPPPLDNDDNPLQVGVFEIAPPGFQQIAPADPSLYAFTLLSGGNRTDLNFANALRVMAEKSDALSVDVDDDGKADVGDRIQYTITVVNNDDQTLPTSVFSDSPGVSTRLVNGSVTSSAGNITEGNGTGDSQISINLASVAPQTQVTIMFEVDVIEALELFSNQGSIGWNLSTLERFTLLTDDPDVPGFQDPTVTPGDTAVPCSLIVTTTMDVADSGDTINSLREAILCANSRPGFDTISFEIPGVGPHTIQPGSQLPDITDGVLIDGYTQTGSVPNSNPLAAGLNTILMVELDGSSSGATSSGLRLVAGAEGSTLRGLAINRFPGSGIEIVSLAGSSTISGNFLGTNLAGTAALGNGAHGVFVLNAPGNIIGGDLSANAALANLISGNGRSGVYLRDNASANEVLGNIIGLNIAGTSAVPNQEYGVGIYNGQGNRVGRPTDSPGTGPGNVISGNLECGVDIDSGTSTGTPSSANFVQGNLIGLGSDGLSSLGNQAHGVSILDAADNSVGGPSSRDGNVIASNVLDGVLVETSVPVTAEGVPSTGNVIQHNRIGTARDGVTDRGNSGSGVVVLNSNDNRVLNNTIAFNSRIVAETGVVVNGGVGVVISRNSIFSNNGLGINLIGGSEDSFGVTDNDTQDGDTGSNNLQNYPVLTSAVNGLAVTTITGTMNSTANRTLRIEFFSNTQGDPSGFGEGEVFLAETSVSTNATGDASFSVPISPQVPAGRFITATATLLDNEGAAIETSEFSNALPVEGQIADLELEKNVNDTTPDLGDQVTFTVTLTNGGPNPATNVQVRDVLPAGLTLVSATPQAGTTFADGLWRIPNLSIATGSNTATLTIVATVTASGTSITNTAAVVASDQADPDSTPDNNVGTEDDQASVTLTVPGVADLELSKIVNNTTPDSGDQVTFTVTLTNRGPNPATNVQVRDVLPTGLTLVSATPQAGTTFADGLWQIPNLSIATGSNSATLTISATVTASGTSITNTAAVVASDQSDPDSTPDNNVGTEDDQASVTLAVPGVADLELAKIVNDTTPDSGDQVTFMVTLTNRGPNPATNVQVRDILPAGLTLVSATPPAGTTFAGALWQIPNLSIATGSNTATLTILATVTASGTSITNTAAVVASDQSDPDSTPDNNVGTEDDQASMTLVVPGVADLELAKLVNDTTPDLGDQVTFTVTLTNRGPNPATNVRVRDVLPAGLTLVSATPPDGTTFAGGLWQIPNLPVATGSNTVTLTIVAAVTLAGSSLTNTAEVIASDQTDPDSTPDNAAVGEDDLATATVQASATIGSINGVKFEDINGDGIRNSGIITGSQPDVVFVIDISGSTSSDFEGTPVGDLNNSGGPDTILDAEIAGFISLNRTLIDNGLGDIADIAIVAFSSNAATLDMDPVATGIQRTTHPSTDADGNGTSDVEDILRSLDSTGLTNFEAALRQSIDIFTQLSTTRENGNLVFLSDGSPTTGGPHDDESSTLRGQINNVRAFGVGLGSSLPALQIVDPTAVRFTTTDELLDVFSGIGGGGQQQFSEPGLSGVVIFLDSNNNGVLDVDANNSPIEPVTTTRADDPATPAINERGTYTLTDVPPGTHTVCEVIPAGFSQTTPGGENRCHTVQIGDGGSANNVNFGNQQVTGDNNSITGFVYLDVNNNGVKDPAEIPLPNVPVAISGPVTRTITTAADGSYRFADLPSGTYSIAETQPAAFLDGLDSQGSPLLGSVENDRFFQLTLTGGIDAINYNLGERGLAPPFLSKALLLASTPSPQQLAPRFVPLPLGNPGNGNTGDAEGEFAVFTAPKTGVLTIRNASRSDALPPMEVYSSSKMPIVISNDGRDIRVPVSANQSYLLVAPEGETAGLEFLMDAATTSGASIQFASNPANTLDTNRDGSVTPLDALTVINWLNGPGRPESIQSEAALDSTGDGHVSSLDALVIINFLTLQHATVEGEPRAFGHPFAPRDSVIAQWGPEEPPDSTRDRTWIEAVDAFLADPCD